MLMLDAYATGDKNKEQEDTPQTWGTTRRCNITNPFSEFINNNINNIYLKSNVQFT